MVPLHASGVTACVYHLFSNGVPYLVAVQAGLTTFGNVCLWLATKQTRERLESVEVVGSEVGGGGRNVQDGKLLDGKLLDGKVKDGKVQDDKARDYLSVVAGTVISGCAAKQISDGYILQAYDSFGVDGCGGIALVMIGGAAALNYLKWSDREKRLS
ncbi:hypothetical protein TrRE_jg737 [Triparma retinervis]|uniref:Uncharacterized protein n=1 Tax=Triparma retinervis TaxID=2557542 RepID=A0A9W7A7T1_9STRA|nr:hypothetical protein TrRE_jg737 [Triparma retinervis]